MELAFGEEHAKIELLAEEAVVTAWHSHLHACLSVQGHDNALKPRLRAF